MIFNSIEFAIFLPVVFLIYWLVIHDSLKYQNLFLLAASYFFYGWWDIRFLLLIIASSMVDFSIGKKLKNETNNKKRKRYLFASLIFNLGLLGFFKYYNFFVQSFADAFTLFGGKADVHTLNIILPVGISFYTFQTLSYSIDVFRKKIAPTEDMISFFAFVGFFPQLVAGPIERAANLLPQFEKKRCFNRANATDGMRQILWGIFKKCVIADNCAIYVDKIFDGYLGLSGSTLLFGAFLFAFQIYGDFSGYSDIAIGTARLFGFDLMQNFTYPYFSRDMAEFWRRWHISLTTWFRDYVYIPLGGSKCKKWVQIRNTFIIFLTSGFWHGANWTFIVWGLLNALYFLPLLLLEKNRKNTESISSTKLLPTLKEFIQISATFFLTTIAWVFFRADTVHQAFSYIAAIFSASLFKMPSFFNHAPLFPIFLLIIAEWFQRDKSHALQVEEYNGWTRHLTYASVFMLIFFFATFNKNQFIYFQF